MPRYRDWQPDGLTRWERALNIDRENVEWESIGVWSVASASSDWGDSYTVRREVFYCQIRGCRVDGEPCEHRYTCDCPDDSNPCKHIYRVWTLDRDPYPPPPAVSELAERAAVRWRNVNDLASRLTTLLLDPTMDVYITSDLLMHLRELESRQDGAPSLRLPRHYESDTSAAEEESSDSDDEPSSQGDNHRCRRRRLDDAVEQGCAGTAGAEKRRANDIPEHQVVRLGQTSGQQAQQWRVGDAGRTVTRRRWYCKRRACKGRVRADPCRHRYRCTCQEGSVPTAPCKHVLRVASLDRDEYPPPPDARQEAQLRQEAASAILRSLLAIPHAAERLDVLELGLWRAVRYVVTSLSGMPVPDDALPGLQLLPGSREDGSEHRCQGCWVVLGRLQCARLIPASAVVVDGPGWRVQDHSVARQREGPCELPQCALLWGPLACSHLFTCNCRDGRNPCKHILRVATEQAPVAEQVQVPAAVLEVVPEAVSAVLPAPQLGEPSRSSQSQDVRAPGGSPKGARGAAKSGGPLTRNAQRDGPAGNMRRQRAAQKSTHHARGGCRCQICFQ